MEDLQGIRLEDGYVIGNEITRSGTSTGGVYSRFYEVYKNEKCYFLKVYNLDAFIKDDNKSPSHRLEMLTKMLTQHDYECKLSDFCKEKNLTKVVCAKTHKVTQDSNNTIIPYIIFDRADGDVRRFLEINQSIEDVWKFKSLHDIAVGLEQLHRIKVYHQDIKPSNILTFNQESKISDLGRAIKQDLACPFISDPIFGDKEHAAPEILYGYQIPDITERMLLTDMYLMGSLITYYFSSFSFNGLLFQNLDNKLHFSNYTDSYESVKAFLIEAHDKVIFLLDQELTQFDSKLRTKLVDLVSYLCHPDINQRRNPKTNDRSAMSVRYGMDKVVTKLDNLHKYAEFLFKTKR